MFNHILAFLAGLVAFALSVYAYFERRFMGFPDGFLTELDRAERVLFDIFIWASILAGSWFFFLGWSVPREPEGKKLLVTIFFYIFFIVIFIIIDVYFHRHFVSGGGG
jgi:hypothetical protein